MAANCCGLRQIQGETSVRCMAETGRVPTARDVAARAGVSQAVVSYVLRGRAGGKDRISDETRQRVLAAVEDLGYVPNQVARSLRRQRTECICLVLPRLGIPIVEALAEGLQDAAEQHGYSVIITMASNAEKEARVLDQLRRGIADGVIFRENFFGNRDVAALERLAKSMAVVAMDDSVESSKFDIVRSGIQGGYYEAARYLVQQGHRRIAYVGHLSDRVGLNRLGLFREALHTYGLALNENLIRGGAGHREKAYRSTRELLDLDQRPSAIFVAGDLGATGALWAASDARLRVPEDVAIMGVGNIPEGAHTNPSLTTIGPNPLDFSPAFEMLFSRLDGTAPPEGRVFTQPWQLIRRGSA